MTKKLRIRAGIRVLHLAAQFKQDLVQGVGGVALQVGGQGIVGLHTQGGAGGGVGESDISR